MQKGFTASQIQQLQALGFTQSIAYNTLVLQTVAHTPTPGFFGTAHDFTHANLYVPAFLDKKTEKRVFHSVTDLIRIVHVEEVPVGNYRNSYDFPYYYIKDDYIQLIFGNALSEEEIVAMVLKRIDLALRKVEDPDFKTSRTYQNNRTLVEIVVARLKIIRILILAGNTMYETDSKPFVSLLDKYRR